ncbi:hypothetical protein PF007_g30310 [Phytophthora fragariae]|uniref:Uncharacterized protein n=1 Tax=Phytophthora fragariae TaxID=53985 RepID=A0A6A3P9A1_9STRA|nr:hypothetical protein PF006_g32882 [Phytophthora fragariae]KAE9061294.1 hypothetical protein PF007_g30310 [Phytophthora fragariae]KAE9152448.1 hypothetical protein PF006_g3336 [Phytophthora fragariae]
MLLAAALSVHRTAVLTSAFRTGGARHDTSRLHFSFSPSSPENTSSRPCSSTTCLNFWK